MITSRMHQEKILYMMKWLPFKRNYTKLGKTGKGFVLVCTLNLPIESRVYVENALHWGCN